MDPIVDKSTHAFHRQFTWTCAKGGCMVHSQIFINEENASNQYTHKDNSQEKYKYCIVWLISRLT